jgi:hypothetical protein
MRGMKKNMNGINRQADCRGVIIIEKEKSIFFRAKVV